MTHGIKLVFRNDGQVLGMPGPGGYNLPSLSIKTGADVKDSCTELFHHVTGKRKGEIIPVFRGSDDEFGIASSYVTDWDSKVVKGAKWVSVRDILLGKWGLFAIDVFNRLGIMKRPRLDIKQIYRISQKALNSSSSDAGDAIDVIMDEVALLIDIRKPWAIDSLLRKIDVTRLHGDVIHTIQSVVEEIPNLPSKEAFNKAAESRLEQIDGRRTKIRFGGISDVRAAALKIYRKRGHEFGQALRAGTLSQRFPYMKHIADAEARLRERGLQDESEHNSVIVSIPLEEWPDHERIAALRGDLRTDVVTRSPDGVYRDPRGVYDGRAEEEAKHKPWRLVEHRRLNPHLEPGYVPDPNNPFRKALDEAYASAQRKTEIGFDDSIYHDAVPEQANEGEFYLQKRQESASDNLHEGPRWARENSDVCDDSDLHEGPRWAREDE